MTDDRKKQLLDKYVAAFEKANEDRVSRGTVALTVYALKYGHEPAWDIGTDGEVRIIGPNPNGRIPQQPRRPFFGESLGAVLLRTAR